LEFAIDAAAVRNAALKYFNNQSIADEMEPYANAYRNLFNPDPSIQFFCNRDANGTFVCPQNPILPHPWEEGGFIESNAIQYRWYAPGNVSDLISLFSSVGDAAGFLETYFVDTWFWPFNTTLPNPFYWGGNEPTMLTPFEFNYMGNEYVHRTNTWVRKIVQELYFFGALGVPGNSDYGALPSGQVFMYLGFYPVPPTTQYALYAPWYSHAEIRLPVTNGQPLRAAVRLIAFNHVPGVVNYLVNAEVNGRNMTTPFVTHEELMNVVPQGGTPTIFFYCTQTPVVYGDVSQTKKVWMPKELSDEEKEFRKAQVEKLGAKVWDMFKH
jgi:putative alpha-1,2-mannosidase